MSNTVTEADQDMVDAREILAKLESPMMVEAVFAGIQRGRWLASTRQIDLEAQISSLKAALRFYAEKRLYVNVGMPSDLYNDRGAIARKALGWVET